MARTYIKPKIIVFGLLISFLLPIPRIGAQPLDRDPAARQFHLYMDAMISGACADGMRVGVKFYSLEKKETLYSLNSDQLFTPASNQKLITSIAALKKVGPGYKFHTRLYADGPVEDGVLKGNLYIKGFGDPSLVTEQMWILVNELRHLPVTRIEGDIITDKSYFIDQGRIKTWEDYEGPEAYLAPVGALSYNFNTVTVQVAPGKAAGEPALVVVEHPTDFHRVTNSAVTTAGTKGRGRLIVNRLPREHHDEIVVTGSLPLNVARKKYYLNVTDPERYTGQAFMGMLKQAGVEVTGTLKRGRVPGNRVLLVEHESPPLGEILRGLNKYSNNFIAEQIIRTLAAEQFGPPGTTENGVKLLQEYLQSMGFQTDQYRVLDGSGLSRGNKLSPDLIVRVLEDAYNDMSIFPELIAALGVMGLDGSVEDRMDGVADSHKVRAKTGTLNHVSALSGYFQSSDGERFVFSILLNDLKCSNGRAMALQDQILDAALKFHRTAE